MKDTLPVGFEPLNETLRSNGQRPHATIRIPRDGIQMLAEPINAWTTKYGKLPQITDIISHSFQGIQLKLKD